MENLINKGVESETFKSCTSIKNIGGYFKRQQ